MTIKNPFEAMILDHSVLQEQQHDASPLIDQRSLALLELNEINLLNRCDQSVNSDYSDDSSALLVEESIFPNEDDTVVSFNEKVSAFLNTDGGVLGRGISAQNRAMGSLVARMVGITSSRQNGESRTWQSGDEEDSVVLTRNRGIAVWRETEATLNDDDIDDFQEFLDLFDSYTVSLNDSDT